MNKTFNIEKELSELKKEMKRINYRDISKIIINNYISKNKKELPPLNNKKEKADYILTLLDGKELEYFKKIVITYFDSNLRSHISYAMMDLDKKIIIGSPHNETSLIDKITNDYFMKIFDERDDNNIKNYFDIKKVIKDLYENYLNQLIIDNY